MNHITISDFLSQEYSIPGAELTLFRESPDNYIYMVKIEGVPAYVLRISKRENIIIEDINFEVEIIEEALSKGIKVVKVVKDKEGNLVTMYENKVSVLFVFELGKSIENDIENIPDIKSVMNAGSALADLHNAWEGYTPKSIKSRNYLTEYERFFQNESFFVDNFENGKEVIDLAKDLYDFARSNDTKEIIHNDFRSQNIFFEENSFDVKLILDFDWSCLGNNLKDISHSMIEWSMPDGVKV